ncbi:MAG: 2-dehydropantoate 2-reductase [Trueperaceae bacterium]
MTLAIWGAGAIGGTIGAYLARAGYDVTLIDAHEAHVTAIREHGLKIVGPIASFTTPVRVVTPAELEGTFDTILLCVKAQATEAALDQLTPHLSEDGAVVSVQNGLNEIAIARRVGEAHTVGAFVNFGADVLEAGTVQYAGRGAFVLGELDGRRSERVDRLADALHAFEPEVQISDNLWGFLWGKMGYGAMLFASALSDDAIADVLDAAEARPILIALAGEVLAVAAAERVRPMGFNGFDPVAFGPYGTAPARDASFAEMVAFNRRSAKSHSGVWRDLAIHKRPTEVRAQFDPIVDAAERHGVDVPAIRRLVDLMLQVESGVRPQSWATMMELADAVPATGREGGPEAGRPEGSPA